jgi:hypothetical protein
MDGIARRGGRISSHIGGFQTLVAYSPVSLCKESANLQVPVRQHTHNRPFSSQLVIVRAGA